MSRDYFGTRSLSPVARGEVASHHTVRIFYRFANGSVSVTKTIDGGEVNISMAISARENGALIFMDA